MGDVVVGVSVPFDPSWVTSDVTRVTRTVSSNTTVTSADMMIVADASSAAVTVQLPKASDYGIRRLDVKKDNASGSDVTVMPATGETIDGSPMFLLTGTVRPSIGLVPIGSGWRVV